MALNRELSLHELDVAWILALWKAIHGGDPSPEVAEPAVLAAAALASQLAASHGGSALTFPQLQERLAGFGVTVTHGPEREAAAQTDEEGRLSTVSRQYCFHYNGGTSCVDVPPVRTHPPIR
ncbi:hypothetical protein CFP65_1372 [Kitasatospora sp. MMS16-BH015]|uniref:hypothetical protein n=1 Tax=Kitasatospora sp. MMS16-BH015 TaxID=2018025 RepID=UPI000CA1B358|nr:hypothetical protein [Kitasatospora sp. MMS16-BH015]AUG76271.1 hypothetical protein CFP65_1372 [Kitasatospora sp. MMS16-BH015]